MGILWAVSQNANLDLVQTETFLHCDPSVCLERNESKQSRSLGSRNPLFFRPYRRPPNDRMQMQTKRSEIFLFGV